MSTNCIKCIKAPRTGTDLLCDDCRKKDVSDIVVRFKEPHPHAGETGTPTGKKMQVVPGGAWMWEFILIDCKHGIEGWHDPLKPHAAIGSRALEAVGRDPFRP